MENAKPTGCYKCGRPGHWSRDCPSSSSSSKPNADVVDGKSPSPSLSNSNNNNNPLIDSNNNNNNNNNKSSTKKKIKPKLSPELLVSDNGLGYVLLHFPRNFNYHGPGHEVNDLGNLLGLYKDWHSHLLPYYSFDHFVHKLQQVASTKRLKMTINQLRERVACGQDPANLPLSPHQHDTTDQELDHHHSHRDSSPINHDLFQEEEDLLHDFFDKEQSTAVSDGPSGPSDIGEAEITQEQRSRMEANRLKALERAKARSQSKPAS